MAPDSKQPGLLDGVDDIIDRWLSLDDERVYGRPPRYRSVTAGKDCIQPSTALPVGEILERIESNWKNAGERSGSTENWRWKKNLIMNPRNNGEKQLEKLAVFLLGDEWANQIPVCSGLTVKREGKMAIDIARETTPGEIDFVELKFTDSVERGQGGDSQPLFAAFEILKYGLVYVFARTKGLIANRKLQNQIRCACKIHLIVLAPHEFYTGYNLAWLELEINKSLEELFKQNHEDFSIDFRFEQLAKDFGESYRQLRTCVEQFRETFPKTDAVRWG